MRAGRRRTHGTAGHLDSAGVAALRSFGRAGEVRALIHDYPLVCLVLGVGLVIRAILVPITHGQDFVVWDLASSATLRGINIYAHHPHYPHGPYAYFPLFLDVELPFQWLAQHTPVPFQTLGKLPIIGADVLVAVMIAKILTRSGRSERAIATGMALFLLNPLVLYNGAFYGRFDSVGCALLLTALWYQRAGKPASRAMAWWYALAVAAKTFPLFVLPKLLATGRAGAVRVVGALIAVLGLLSLPYLAAPRQYLTDIVLHDATKKPQALSWQPILLHVTSPHGAQVMSYLCLAVFAAGACWLLRITDISTYCLLVLLLFVVFSKVVLEQYLIWPIPLLILQAFGAGNSIEHPPPGSARMQRGASLALLAVLTTVGMVVNPYIHPFGQSPLWIAVPLAITILAYALVIVREQRGAAR